MYFNLRLLAMTQGLRLRILLAALVGLLAVALGIMIVGLWVYGVFGEAREHIGM